MRLIHEGYRKDTDLSRYSSHMDLAWFYLYLHDVQQGQVIVLIDHVDIS